MWFFKLLKFLTYGGGLAFVAMLAALFFTKNDGVGLACPNYGILETKASPNGQWVAEIGVEGCLQGGATSVLLRKSSEREEFRKAQRLDVYGDFPTAHVRWNPDGSLTVSLSNDARGGDHPLEWRGVRISYETYTPTDEEKRRRYVIGAGDVRIE